jgi:hypothetical protein
MDFLSRFKEIFWGLDCAYGTYKIEGTNEKNKQIGKGFVVRKPPTDDLWKKHLDGDEPSLGIIPIREDNSCTWGAIDVDQYPLDLQELVEKVKKLELPLVTFRSKSGGAHVYAFTKKPVPAIAMQKYLNACAALLGQSGREIFPKQSEILVKRGDTGNFLNLPFHGASNGKTLRYALNPDGTAATLEEFFKLYEDNVQETLKPPKKKKVENDLLKDGPPCLQALCAQGFPEGTRNNGLFSLGIFLKKAFPEKWEDKLLEFNMKFFQPPLGIQELQVVSQQLQKKDYKYKCKDEPIKSFCNSSLCRARKYGIGGDGPDSPQLASLSKYNSEPPLWFLDVNGKRVELETDNLFNQLNFQRACMERLNVLPPTMKKPDWESLINELLTEMVELEQITEASEDTKISGRFMDLVEEFTTHLQQGIEREEILLGRVWTDEENGEVFFRIKDLEAHLKRSNFSGLSLPKISQRLRDMGAVPTSLSLKGRTTRLWKMPVFEKQDTTFDSPTQYDDVPF